MSPRTITRRIKAYGLKGIRPKGRKRAVKRPRAPKPREEWITTKEYFDRLNSVYHFINIRYPAVRYINPKTLVCSNTKSNPKGKFTTVGIYYVVEESNVYFLYQTSARALANLLLKPHGSLGWYVLEEGIAEIGYRPELRYNVPYEYFRVPYGWLWRPDMQDRVEQLATSGPNDNYFFYTPKDLEK